jgi:hypothetical protein
MLFSVLALLVVVAVVMKLSATSLQAVKTSVPAAGAGGKGADPAARAVDLMNKTVEQGAAQRAAEAASQ